MSGGRGPVRSDLSFICRDRPGEGIEVRAPDFLFDSGKVVHVTPGRKKHAPVCDYPFGDRGDLVGSLSPAVDYLGEPLSCFALVIDRREVERFGGNGGQAGESKFSADQPAPVVEEEEFEFFFGHLSGRNPFTKHLRGEEQCADIRKYS